MSKGHLREPRRKRTVDALASAAEEGRGHATKRLGELRASCEPRESEWGNPAVVIRRHPRLNT
jgi:hypothetical protein